MKRYLFIFLLGFFFINCTKKQDKNRIVNDVNVRIESLNTSKSSINVIGTYKGQISCDDCEFVELTLKENNKYTLLLHLISEDKSDDNMVKEEGKYVWKKEDSILSLDKYGFRFKVSENKLYYLGNSSKIDEQEILTKE